MFGVGVRVKQIIRREAEQRVGGQGVELEFGLNIGFGFGDGDGDGGQRLIGQTVPAGQMSDADGEKQCGRRAQPAAPADAHEHGGLTVPVVEGGFDIDPQIARLRFAVIPAQQGPRGGEPVVAGFELGRVGQRVIDATSLIVLAVAGDVFDELNVREIGHGLGSCH